MGAKIISGEEKSPAEREKEVLEKHEQAQKPEETQEPAAETTPAESTAVETPETTPETTETPQENPQPAANEIDEGTFFSFAKDKLGREVNSWEDLVEVKEKELELPEDVSAFYEYKTKTGRSLNDFIELNRDYDSMSDEEVVKRMYVNKSKGLDKEDIEFEYSRKFGYDSDIDDDDDIRLKNIALKREATEAREYFNQQKEQFNVPLESSTPLVSDEDKEAFEAFQQYKQSESTQQTQREELLKRSNYFQEKTNELLNDKFEGFKFKVGDKEVKYNPGDVSKIKEMNSSIQNFASKHLNEDGYIKDPEAYHKALTIANDPDAFFKYAYELGQAAAVNDVVKTGKNVDMQVNKAPQETSNGTKGARIIGPESSNKQKIINYRQ